MGESTALKFEGASQFRQRIAMSLLSGRTVKFENIRSQEEKPGLLGNLEQFICCKYAINQIWHIILQIMIKFF